MWRLRDYKAATLTAPTALLHSRRSLSAVLVFSASAIAITLSEPTLLPCVSAAPQQHSEQSLHQNTRRDATRCTTAQEKQTNLTSRSKMVSADAGNASSCDSGLPASGPMPQYSRYSDCTKQTNKTASKGVDWLRTCSYKLQPPCHLPRVCDWFGGP